MTKTAVILFNLGGPDCLEAVQPFLFNLFYDPVIFPLGNPFRYLLAQFVSRRRRKEAQKIYTQLGGASPLYPNTYRQAQALEKELGENFKVFIAMRYWHPRAEAVLREVRAFEPDQVILLPLYPHYSITTTGSSLNEWRTLFKAQGTQAKTLEVCCYPQEEGLIQASAELLQEALKKIPIGLPCRVLFSAHGLPERIIKKGDPYSFHIQKTADAIIKELKEPEFDYRVCYQSRLGPEKWIGPSTSDEIKRAGKEGIGLVVFPLSFVSEHSETLVELDKEYRQLATSYEVSFYLRVSTVSIQPAFIKGLKNLVLKTIQKGAYLEKTCSTACTQCPQNLLMRPLTPQS